MNVGIIGSGKIGKAIGEIAKSFCKVFYIDKKEPYSNDFSLLENCDINFICVNTTEEDSYNTKNVEDCIAKSNFYNLKNIVILSTCPPSFFDNYCNDEIIYSPLFIRQGNIKDDIKNAEFILVGSNPNKDIKIFYDFFHSINNNFKFFNMSHKEAAIVKMSINGFLTLKIAYANMIGDYCVDNDLRPDLVLDCISSFKPINSHYFKYGYGFGGPCLPIDNTTLAKELNKKLPLFVDEENKNHLKFQFEQFIKKNKDKSIFYEFEDLGYKKNLSLINNSQKLELAAKLAKENYKIAIKDSEEVCNLIKQNYGDLFLYKFVYCN